MELEVVLHLEKETPNTVRFAEPETDEAPVLRTIYVQKWAIRKLGNPTTIRVTISAQEE